MKTHSILGAFALLLSTIIYQPSSASAQGTVFTYQGRLNDTGHPANGFYDIHAGLYVTSTGGTVVAGPITNSAVAVSSGLFTLTLDYGNVFDGTIYWLEMAVRTNGGGAFSLLSPRQQLTAAPYALFASTASNLSGTVATSGLSGTYAGAVNFNNPFDSFTGNGTGLTNVNAATLGGLSVAGFWQTTGNAGTTPGVNFVGTTDNKPLDFYANNVRALRLVLRTDAAGPHTNAPNVIGGSSVNQVSAGVVGATVGGGGGNYNDGTSYPNEVTADFGTVGGGINNSASADSATVGGGVNNTASGGEFSTVGGGAGNTASADTATVGGGYGNTASGIGSFIGGGGYDGVTTSGNRVQSKAATIGGGLGNHIPGGAEYAVIGGGVYNTNSGTGSFIGGGGSDGLNVAGNTIQANGATIGGGLGNNIPGGGEYAVIGGGYVNTASGHAATVTGGYKNLASGTYSFAGGFGAMAKHDGSFVWSDASGHDTVSFANNQFMARASGGVVFLTTIADSPTDYAADSAGAALKPGATSWSSVSDRNAKKNFQPVDTVAVLNKLAAIPVEQWNYKWEADTNTPNLGPMAQDFKAAFYPGRDDKSISTLEFDGVELAAIQGLDRKLGQLRAELKHSEAENAELKQELGELKQLVNQLNRKVNGGSGIVPSALTLALSGQ